MSAEQEPMNGVKDILRLNLLILLGAVVAIYAGSYLPVVGIMLVFPMIFYCVAHPMIAIIRGLQCLLEKKENAAAAAWFISAVLVLLIGPASCVYSVSNGLGY